MNIFSLIKTHVSILDVAKEYTNLKPAGNYLKGQCPFHHEKTASFTVSPHKGIFYCFGCHSGGDVVAFITKAERCTPLEAVKHLAERHGIELPQETPAPASHKHEKELYTLAHEVVAQWCIEQFKKSRPAQDYIQKRGITAESIQNYGIGYFPGGQQSIKSLLKAGKEKNILAQDFIQANILRASERDTLYSPYEERITFPIQDALGRACGLGGRIFAADDSRAKYYNSQDHPYFSKGSILYGFHQAKKYIQETGTVFLVEGYLDCIAFAQAGLRQTVATLGTACTAEHIKILSRHVEKLYTVYDGDAAGQKAALRLTQLCWDVELEPYVIQLPQGEDPCSLVAKGFAVDQLPQAAVNIFEYFIQTTAQQPREISLQERMASIKSITELIAQIQDPIKQDFLLQKASNTCQIPYATLKESLLYQPKKTFKKIPPEAPPTHPVIKPEEVKHNTQIEISDLEKKIFSAIMSKKYILKPEEHAFLKLAFSSYLFPIIERLQSYKGTLDAVSVTDLCTDTQREFIVSLLMEDEVQGQGPALDELFLQFYQKRWKMIVNSVKIKIAEAQKLNHNQELEMIITQFQNLKQKIFGKDSI